MDPTVVGDSLYSVFISMLRSLTSLLERCLESKHWKSAWVTNYCRHLTVFAPHKSRNVKIGVLRNYALSSSYPKTQRSLVTQPILQRRPHPTELRLMDYYHQIFCRFRKCKWKVPPPSPLSNDFEKSWVFLLFF